MCSTKRDSWKTPLVSALSYYQPSKLTWGLVFSVQAIVISTEVAHNLGFSQLNANLLGAAIRIAQCLGLHKIALYELGTSNSPELTRELVAAETGKRVLCQMILQELFAIPFNDTYGESPNPCRARMLR